MKIDLVVEKTIEKKKNADDLQMSVCVYNFVPRLVDRGQNEAIG